MVDQSNAVPLELQRSHVIFTYYEPEVVTLRLLSDGFAALHRHEFIYFSQNGIIANEKVI